MSDKRTISETNTITGEKRTRLTYTELGKIVLAACGEAMCQTGYHTTDPESVGRYALDAGDINANGTLN